jgi:hypothetical protein
VVLASDSGAAAVASRHREAKVFRRCVVGGLNHLIIRVTSGEIGFYVPDNAAWIAALTMFAPHL